MSVSPMKRNLTIILQTDVVLIGIAALAFLLGEPHVEGRNAHATLFEIYFKDPFLAYAYIGSIPFFIALYQIFKALAYVKQNKTFSQATVKALGIIKKCAGAFIAFVVGGMIFIALSNSEDRPAGIFMGMLILLPSIIVAIAAAKFERIVKNTMPA